jgi:hypothetical protein
MPLFEKGTTYVAGLAPERKILISFIVESGVKHHDPHLYLFCSRQIIYHNRNNLYFEYLQFLTQNENRILAIFIIHEKLDNTTILYTSKKNFFLNHNTGTILEQIFIPVLCTILVYQYCDRQVQEIRLLLIPKYNTMNLYF